MAYRIPNGDVGGGMLVIHRVVGGNTSEGLILQGDNRDTPDLWRPRTGDVVGALQWHVPHAGTALFLLRTPLVIAGVIGFLGFWAVVSSPDRRPKPPPAASRPPEPPTPRSPFNRERVAENARSAPARIRTNNGGPLVSPATLASFAVVAASLAAFRAAKR